MRASLILPALLLAGCASMTTEEKWAIGLAAADVATTAYALERGARELNPVLSYGDPSNGEVIVRAVALNALVHWMLRHYYSNGHRGYDRRGWRIVVWIRAAPVAWNVKEILEGSD